MREQSPAEVPASGSEVARKSWGWGDAIGIQLVVIALVYALQQILIARKVADYGWGFMAEQLQRLLFLMGLHVAVHPAPLNWIICAAGVVVAITIGAICRRQRWLLWVSGAQFAVTSIAVLAAIAFLGALIPQDADQADQLARLGLRAIYTSLPLIAAASLMLLNLGTLLGRRLLTPRSGYFAFLLNHLGMALVIIGMIAGPAQFARPTIELHEGEATTTASVENGPPYNLEATVGLTHFSIEKYPPKLAAEEMKENGRMVSDSDWISQGRQFEALGLHVSVLEYLPIAMPDEKGGWTKSDSHGLPAARLAVTGPDGLAAEGWVAPPYASLGIAPQPLTVGDKYVVEMLEQQPKAYRSQLTINEPGHAERTVTLEVNHPVRVGEWQLYQSDYRIDMGGRMSIIQAVRDPALPVVYTGLLFMVLGSFLALWFTTRRRVEPTTPTDGEEA